MPIRILIPKLYRIASVGRQSIEKWTSPDSIYKRLPDHYKERHIDFLNRIPKAVHYVYDKRKFIVDHETGTRKRVQNTPLAVIYPAQSKLGLWGGEGVVPGYKRPRKQRGFKRPQHLVTKLWRPRLRKVLFYSEILNKYYALTTTRRALNLIEEAAGFDNYILKTHQVDLKSDIGMQLKREMLIALAKPAEHLWPEDQEKQAVILQRYKKFAIPLEEAEWIGLTPWEAMKKQKAIETAKLQASIKPLKLKFADELIESINQLKLEGKDVMQTLYPPREVADKPASKNVFRKMWGEWTGGSGSRAKS